jgi:hypothetical protein
MLQRRSVWLEAALDGTSLCALRHIWTAPRSPGPRLAPTHIKRLTLYDDRHDTIATVTDNVVWVRNDVRKRSPRTHSQFNDHNDDVALKIDYNNPRIIITAGIFRN